MVRNWKRIYLHYCYWSEWNHNGESRKKITILSPLVRFVFLPKFAATEIILNAIDLQQFYLLLLFDNNNKNRQKKKWLKYLKEQQVKATTTTEEEKKTL